MWALKRELRDAITYILGGVGFLHELIIANAERPFILTASLALLGFPLVLKGEEKIFKSNQNKNTQSKDDV